MEDKTKYFILLCSEKRQGTYDEVIAQASYPVEVVNTPDECLKACVREPPYAVIVDMITGMRAGSTNTSLLVLYNLELTWPVLRSTAKRNEPVMIVSTSPQNTAPFVEAISAIATNDPSWLRPQTPRRFIRQTVQCRSRSRVTGEEDRWHQGTIMEISTGGCFLITYEPLPIDSQMELEIWDLSDKVMTVRGHVVWIRAWDDGPELPGMGVAFDLSSVPPELAKALGQAIL
jgi:hypothetical protein